jgi:hypothetical protein
MHRDALGDLVPDILGIHDDDDELFMAIDAFYWEDEDADLWNSDDELDHAELHMLQNLRRPRSAQTYKYSGDQTRKRNQTRRTMGTSWSSESHIGHPRIEIHTISILIIPVCVGVIDFGHGCPEPTSRTRKWPRKLRSKEGGRSARLQPLPQTSINLMEVEDVE